MTVYPKATSYTAVPSNVSYKDYTCNNHVDTIEMRLHEEELRNYTHSRTVDTASSHGQVASKQSNIRPAKEPVSMDTASLLPKSPSRGTSRHRFELPSLSGWRIGALMSLIGAAFVFILNLALTIWVLHASNYQTQGGVGTLFEGSCATTRTLNVLCSPNREEIDRAHESRSWLHVGIPSIHNLKFIQRERSFLWITLLVSSMPLHLLYNSVVFTNLQANSYAVIPTTDDWFYSGVYNSTNFFDIKVKDKAEIEKILNAYRPVIDQTITLNNGSQLPRYKNMSTEACFHAFDTQYVSEYGNVYIAQSESTTWRNQTLWRLAVHNSTGEYSWYADPDQTERAPLWYNKLAQQPIISMPFQSNPRAYPSSRWRCPPLQGSTCDYPQSWKPYESTVRYCVVEQVAEICKLQFSFLIVSIILVSNFVKAACMFRLFFSHYNHHALVTLGDAVASFLERPDVHTIGRCLPSEVKIDKAYDSRTFVAPEGDIVRYYNRHEKELQNKRRAFRLERIKWSAASSHGAWFATYSFCSIAVIFGIVAIILSLRGIPKSPAQLWKIGFGSVDGRNLLTSDLSFLRAAMLANSPQAILSYLYLAFNRLYTSMLLGKEWSSYLHQRKTLRVTVPEGQQRSTYWLSIPYRFSVPVVIVSGIFHWLASQSLFMVQITITRTQNSGPREVVLTEQISTCGFSPFAIILTTVTATIIAIGGIVMGQLRYPAGMPLASSCSAVMSAACHRPPGDEKAYLYPVQWGAVSHGSSSDERPQTGVGHCSFSSNSVEAPICGRCYA